MAYILNQYNKNINNTDKDKNFMSFVNEGEAIRTGSEQTFNTTSGKNKVFRDECCSGLNLQTLNKYYLHCKIRKDLKPMVFNIKLVNINVDNNNAVIDTNVEQYIKTVSVVKGINDKINWQDIELIFTPSTNFNAILFELEREIDDYDPNKTRYPHIAYLELSQINNIISSVLELQDKEFIKIGVQSRPGIMMCINGEEIRTPRSGIYELRDGDIVVSFFSIVNGAKEDTDKTQIYMNEVDNKINNNVPPKDIDSKCFFNTENDYFPKTRTIDSFSLDYVYKEEV